MQLEETNNRHLKWKNVDYSKTIKEIIIRRHRIGEKLSSDNTAGQIAAKSVQSLPTWS